MTFRVLLDGSAQRDFEQIEEWFYAHASDQAERFIDDFDTTQGVLAEHAMLRPEIRPDVRRESLRIFKYHLWYRTFSTIGLVEVFAVLHHHRGPNELNARL